MEAPAEGLEGRPRRAEVLVTLPAPGQSNLKESLTFIRLQREVEVAIDCTATKLPMEHLLAVYMRQEPGLWIPGAADLWTESFESIVASMHCTKTG